MCVQLEIKGYLESVYGMVVERVHTINYLGKRRLEMTNQGRTVGCGETLSPAWFCVRLTLAAMDHNRMMSW